VKPENTDYSTWNFSELYQECVKRGILKRSGVENGTQR